MLIRGKDLIFESVDKNKYLVYQKRKNEESQLPADENDDEQLIKDAYKFEVDISKGFCTCLKPTSHGMPCKHLLKIIGFLSFKFFLILIFISRYDNISCAPQVMSFINERWSTIKPPNGSERPFKEPAANDFKRFVKLDSIIESGCLESGVVTL